jgi:hypothetical protein
MNYEELEYNNFADYLDSIGLTQTAYTDRARLCFKRLVDVLPTSPVAALVEDAVDEEGARKFLHLAVITDGFIGFAQDFVRADHLVLSPLLLGPYGTLTIKSSEFDRKRATASSRLFIGVVPEAPQSWSIEVTGNNCDHAWKVFKENIQPQLFPPA